MNETFNGAPESATTLGPVGTHATTVNAEGKVVSTGTEARSTNKATVSQKLAKIQPSRSPLDTFLRNIHSGNTKSDKYEFYSIVSRGVASKVGGETAISFPTGGSSVMKIKVAPGGIHHLSKDGDLLVPSYNVADGVAAKTDGLATRPLVLHIVAINYVDSTIDVVANAVSGADIEVGTEIFRMASAKDQDAAISDDPHATPTKDYNYCQRNIVTVSENAFQALQEKEVEYGLAEFKEQAFADFRYQAELTSIFGAGVFGGNEALIDPYTQKRKLHMRGLVDFGIQSIGLETSKVDASINTMLEKMFSVNNGSNERLMIYGAGFGTHLSNSKDWVKQLEAKQTDVAWGLRWKLFECNYGIVRAIYSPALTLAGYGGAALIIDPNNLRRIDQIKLHERKLDLQTAGIRNTKDVMLEESWTLEVTNPTTHGLIYF